MPGGGADGRRKEGRKEVLLAHSQPGMVDRGD